MIWLTFIIEALHVDLMHFLVAFAANDQPLRIQVSDAIDLLILCIVKIYGSFRL